MYVTEGIFKSVLGFFQGGLSTGCCCPFQYGQSSLIRAHTYWSSWEMPRESSHSVAVVATGHWSHFSCIFLLKPQLMLALWESECFGYKNLSSHADANGILRAYFRIPKIKKKEDSCKASQTERPEDNEIG